MWNLELDPDALSLVGPAAPGNASNSTIVGDVTDLVAAIGPGCEVAAVEQLVLALRAGGTEVTEAACGAGAVECSLALLEQGQRPGSAAAPDVRLLQQATEALWWLASDYDGCQPFIRGGGHGTLIRLMREQGPQDQLLAISGFRTLASTLYNEGRRADFWRTADFDFVVQALAWALESDVTRTEDGVNLLVFMLDIAALWCQRADQPGQEAAKRMVAIIPMLLQTIQSHFGHFVLMGNVCRFLWVLATKCESWPAAVREPAGIALSQLQLAAMMSQSPDMRAYCSMALQAVTAIPEAGQLSAMD